MKNKNKKEATKEVLTPTEKTVELIQEAPAKAKRKHYHKPKAKVTVEVETPAVEAVVEVKKTWLQTNFPKFSAWLNEK